MASHMAAFFAGCFVMLLLTVVSEYLSTPRSNNHER
jgi:hypothetical protein